MMLSCLVWVATSARAGPPHDLIERLHQTIEADADRLKVIFKDLHQNPELGFQEVRTAGILAKELEALGYEVKTGIGVTGVVGILRNGEGPTVMYRADMDANAVREETGLPYASTATTRRTGADGKEEEVPVAHLCGHDAHVTWMIGLAKAFAEHKAHWSGTLVLVGQPAEEPVAGAKAMVHDGMYTRHGVPIPDVLIGLHTAAIRTGVVACAAGDINAGTDQLDVTFFGVGGHGSSPHLTKDPVLMACTAVIQYQFIVSRAIDPANSAVVTVGSVQAGSDNNVIPASSLLKINLRWYDPEDRKLMLESIERINRSIASAYNLPEALYPKTVMKGGSVVLSNNRELALKVAPVLKSILGEKSVMLSVPRVMGSEDFHHLVVETGKNIPYLYLYVGTAKPEHFDRARAEGKLVPYANHNPDYQVDIDAIPLGAKIGAASVARLFQPAE
jgi:hippurate hydrolase